MWLQIFYKFVAIVLKQYQIISCNNSRSVTTIVKVIDSNFKFQRPYVSVNLLLFLFVDICQQVFRLR